MSRGRVVCEIVHAWALGVWLGGLGLAAGSAAIVFPVLKELDPSLPGFAKYEGPHWVLAGGRIAARVFLVLDVAQWVCALVAGGTLALAIARLGLPVQRVSTFLRVALVLALVGILSYRLAVLEPGMQRDLHAYWAAAERGENETAARFREAFDRGHPLQTRLLGATAVLVLTAAGAALWSVGRREGVRNAPVGGLEEPRLVRGRR